MDHFICSVKGRLYDSFGKTRDAEKYTGGCIFVDHLSGYIHVEHKVSINISESIKSKLKFEQAAYDMGVKVQAYQSDQGRIQYTGSTYRLYSRPALQ